MKLSTLIFLGFVFSSTLICDAQDAGSPNGRAHVPPAKRAESASSSENAAETPVDFKRVGFSKQKPESGPSVAIEGGFMVPYTVTIPGSETTFEMSPIPGGEFQMGSPEGEKDRRPDEGPQVKVTVDPFWMGKYEVTWGEYNHYMRLEDAFVRFKQQEQRLVNEDQPQADSLSAPSKSYKPKETYDAGEGDNQPAATMTQFAAKQYTKFLSLLVDDFYRLPTEAEWEYACRAGTTTTFYFGDDVNQLQDHAWFYDNSDDYRQEVGTKKPNPWGLHDMYGNVSEWVLDQYAEDSYARLKDKTNTCEEAFLKPTKLYPRICRGGSFELEAEDCRSSARQPTEEDGWKEEDPNIPQSPWWFTDSPATGIGFRIMRPLKTPANREDKESYWSADVAGIYEDVKDRIKDNGRGAFGIVDPGLPEAIKNLPEKTK